MRLDVGRREVVGHVGPGDGPDRQHGMADAELAGPLQEDVVVDPPDDEEPGVPVPAQQRGHRLHEGDPVPQRDDVPDAEHHRGVAEVVPVPDPRAVPARRHVRVDPDRDVLQPGVRPAYRVVM